MTAILAKFWKEILLTIILGLGSYFLYEKVKHIGYVEAEAKYMQIIQEDVAKRNAKIDSIESLATKLAADQAANSATLSENIDKIIKGQKNKPLVIVKDGECNPTPAFSDSFKEINKRTNESMKESRK